MEIRFEKHVDYREFFSAIENSGIVDAESAESDFNYRNCPANDSSVGICYWDDKEIESAECGEKAMLLFMRDNLKLQPQEMLYIDVSY